MAKGKDEEVNLMLADIEDGKENRFVKKNHFDYFLLRRRYIWLFNMKPATFYNKELKIAIRLTIDGENLLIEFGRKPNELHRDIQV